MLEGIGKLNGIDDQDDTVETAEIGQVEDVVFAGIVPDIAADIAKGDEMLQADAVGKCILPDAAENAALVFLVKRGYNDCDMRVFG